MELIQEYAAELAALKERMEDAQEFAEKFPMFRDVIIREKLSQKWEYVKFGERYKSLTLRWGINRGRFDSTTGRHVTNYAKPHNLFLFSLYFNSCDLFDSDEEFGLEELAKIDGVFFFDNLNSTFYVTDEAIGRFLDAANEWYLSVIEKMKEDKKRKRIEEAKRVLAELQ